MNILECFYQNAPQKLVRAISPCKSSAKIWNLLTDYITQKISNTKNYAKATTITIGNKYYGSMSAKQQYKQMSKDIKKHISERPDKNCKYLYTFELQKNGQLHAHGIELGTWQNTFHANFGKYGRHNLNNKSYTDIVLRNFPSYYEYIHKEQVFPRIHNFTKKELKAFKKATLHKLSPREGGEGEHSSPLSKERSSTNPDIINTI